MHANTGNVCIGRRARVATRVGEIRVLDEQIGGGDVPLLGDDADAASLAVVADHLRKSMEMILISSQTILETLDVNYLVVVIPKYIGWRFRAVFNGAREIYRRS